MAGKSPVMASDEHRAALAALAGSRDRKEADRARAVLLTLAGWTSPKIAEAFGVREDTVRLWRSDFTAGGVVALKASLAPGPPPVKSEAALGWPRPCWKSLWPTGATGRSLASAPRSRRARACASAVRNCPKPCEKKVPLAAAPAHVERTSDGKRDRAGGAAPATAQAAGRSRRHRSSLWRRERVYGDESEALTHPYLARAWAKAGADLPAPAPGPGQEGRDAGLATTSRANSSFIPARPSAAATSSPISSNWTGSMAPSPANPSSPRRSSRTTVQSTPARSPWPRWPPAGIGSPSSGRPNMRRS